MFEFEMLVDSSDSIVLILPDVKLMNSANVACFNILDAKKIHLQPVKHWEYIIFIVFYSSFYVMQALLDYERYKMHGIFPSSNASQPVPGEVQNCASQPSASQV